MTRQTSFNHTYDPPITAADAGEALLHIATIATGILVKVKNWTAPIGSLEVIVREPMPPDEPEARRAIGRDELRRLGQKSLEFGKYVGTPLHDVPLDYLEYFRDASRATIRLLGEYLDHPEIAAERAELEPDFDE